jgi:peptidoglycan/xylan/chitin deacetylase (PgdA/CDA1 family)
MQMLVDDGHEIAFHSHRHHTYADLSYETAYDAITTGVSAIENETGITPEGFFVPFFELSDGSIQAIEDFGFDWLLASTDQELSNVETREPAWPLDTKRFEEEPVSEVMEQFTREARSDEGPFLFHPPVIEYRNGIPSLEQWIDSIQPVSMTEQLQSGGTGIVLDCIQPVRVE